MDPNACLTELLAIAAQQFNDSTDAADAYDPVAQLDRAAELIEALDGWIVKGGFLPERWQKAAKP